MTRDAVAFVGWMDDKIPHNSMGFIFQASKQPYLSFCFPNKPVKEN